MENTHVNVHIYVLYTYLLHGCILKHKNKQKNQQTTKGPGFYAQIK